VPREGGRSHAPLRFNIQHLGFGVTNQELGCGVEGLGLGFSGLGLGVSGWGLGFRVWSLGVRVWGLVFRADPLLSRSIQGLKCKAASRLWGVGLRFWSLGCRVQGFEIQGVGPRVSTASSIHRQRSPPITIILNIKNITLNKRTTVFNSKNSKFNIIYDDNNNYENNR